ncbi:MAG TPA: LysM peptidoglycan-binding domain-containing protein [Acidimicrobiales bacterium]|nr:LysM peptidoglycan-binding domain-containing protein [Acidimicrobiales bacterium]
MTSTDVEQWWAMLPAQGRYNDRNVRRTARRLVTSIMTTGVLVGALTLAGAATSPAGATTVRVAPGQTLTQIAQAYGTTVTALAAANGITNPNQVLSGATLVVPGSATTASPSAASRTITVVSGDTLSTLAARYGVTMAALAAANRITNPNQILIGATLVVPGPGVSTASLVSSGGQTPSVTVQLGDTLTAIAARYGVSVAALAAANGITNPNYVTAGRHLALPALAAASSAPVGGGSASSLPALLQASPDRLALRPTFVQWANTFGVPAALLEAMCWWESGWQSQVVSPTGAIGIGQLEPATTDEVRAQLGQPGLNPAVASDNIEMAARFLADLLRATGNTQTALASYYQGMASLALIGELPSTMQYVNGITAYIAAFS